MSAVTLPDPAAPTHHSSGWIDRVYALAPEHGGLILQAASGRTPDEIGAVLAEPGGTWSTTFPMR